MAQSQTELEGSAATVFVVDDDAMIREALVGLLEHAGLEVQAYASADDFLDAYHPGLPGCLLLDINMPGIDGLELQGFLADKHLQIPIIFLTGQADVTKTTQAFKKGAFDFLEKPVSAETLLERISQALARDARQRAPAMRRQAAWERIEQLTAREREVLVLLASGYSNKQMAKELKISIRTVEGHRRRVYERMAAESFANLIEMTRDTGLLEEKGL